MRRIRIHFAPVLLFFLALAGCQLSEQPPKNQAEKAIFTDETDRLRLDFVHNPAVDGSYFMPESIGSGAALLDYDNDGDLDIYLVNGTYHGKKGASSPPLTNRLFRQEQDHTFSDVTEISGLGDEGYGMGVAVGDVNNDGNVDVYVSNYGPDALYLNQGDGTFANISKRAGIRNSGWGSSVIFLDYNLDNYLDIYVANYLAYDPNRNCMDRSGREDYCGPGGFAGQSDVLYRNNGDATFTDVSAPAGIARIASKGLGVAAADFNDDHYPDLYVANDGEPNQLWINQKDGTFQDQALFMGAALNNFGRPEASMGITIGDIDNDSDLDLFVTHIREESNTFYRHGGDYGYQDDSATSGLAGPSLPFTGFGTGFFDYDHDGDLDLAVVNGRVSRGPVLVNRDSPQYWDDYAEPNFLFDNDGSGPFADPAYTDLVENSRGIALGDIDNDGDIDLLVTNEGGRARVFLNTLENKGNWLMITAADPALHRAAFGAKITVVANGSEITRLISPGYSFLCSNDSRAHFGLGALTAVQQILVTWPDGTTEAFSGTEVNQFITLNKGQGNAAGSNR
ncbi:MAG: CRTAC1 family protein [bacterium]